MKLTDIFILLLYLILFYPIGLIYYKNILKRTSFGRIIIKIKRIKYFFLIPILAFPLILAYNIYNMSIIIDFYKDINSMKSLYEQIFYFEFLHIHGLFASMYIAIVCFRGRYIAEKGICSPEGFCYWSEIKNYMWIDDNRIQFNIETKEFFNIISKTIKWDIPLEQKNYVEKELSKHILKSDF